MKKTTKPKAATVGEVTLLVQRTQDGIEISLRRSVSAHRDVVTTLSWKGPQVPWPEVRTVFVPSE